MHAQEAPTELRIKLLNAHTGMPYVEKGIEIFGTNAASGLKKEDIVIDLHGTTDPNGIAHFQLHGRLPYRILYNTWQIRGCTPTGSFITEDVIHTGIVVANTCAKKSQKFRWQDVTATPGEIVIFAIPPPRG
jgi:hypothetical protein